MRKNPDNQDKTSLKSFSEIAANGFAWQIDLLAPQGRFIYKTWIVMAEELQHINGIAPSLFSKGRKLAAPAEFLSKGAKISSVR